jgi:hypothetical protein
MEKVQKPSNSEGYIGYPRRGLEFNNIILFDEG